MGLKLLGAYSKILRMKIALIVFPLHANHGCILQTYALYLTLIRMGNDVSIIDRQWDKYPLNRRLAHFLKYSILKIMGKYSGPLTLEGENRLMMSNLQPFIDKYLSDHKLFFKNPKYEKLSLYDAFIVGSDQTWRPKYVSDILYYYLSFIPKDAKVKRIAYAPSFGTEEWEYSEQHTLECKKLLGRFDAISVREDSGVDLCNRYFGIKVEHVLDPTMLLNKEDYLGITNIVPSEQNILSYYLLDNSENKMRIIEKICNELNLSAQCVNTEIGNHNIDIEERIAPSIEKWLEGFANSKFIVADSFHATIFALVFNKHFVTIANVNRGMARFKSLLKIFGLENRLITEINQVTPDLICQNIDWEKVNRIMTIKQSASLSYLKFSL